MYIYANLDYTLKLNLTLALTPNPIIYRASLLYDFLARISRDLYETILVGKFPSLEISEKCASHRPRPANNRHSVLSSVPPYLAQCANSGGRSIECNGDMPAAKAVAARGGDARRSLRHHHLCNW